MLYLINIFSFILCGISLLAVKQQFLDKKINQSFHFLPYVFKCKDNVLNHRNCINALADMLEHKLNNTVIDIKEIESRICSDFASKSNIDKKVVNTKKYVIQNENSFNKFISKLNENYFNIFEFDILKINTQKINLNLIIETIIKLNKKYKKIAIILENNDKNLIKTAFFVSNGNVEKKIIYDYLNILSLIKNNYHTKKVYKNKSFSPKILSIKYNYCLATKLLFCVCKNNRVIYNNIFGQKLVEITFENIKFFCQSFIVNNCDLSMLFETNNYNLSYQLIGCMKIDFSSSLIQSMYDNACKNECAKIWRNILSLRCDYVPQEMTPYRFFIDNVLCIKIANNIISICPNRKYINCDFIIHDYNCMVRSDDGKHGYIIDGKKFSNNIPICLDDIEKVDCILY